MPPVRIKLYGLLWMTRRRYARQLVVALTLAAALLAAWWWKWPEMRREVVPGESLALMRFVAVMEALPWIVLAAVGLQLLEALVVFRLFRREEAKSVNPGA